MSAGLGTLNPLRCAGTALPPNVLLVAKVITLGLLLKGYVVRIPGIFLPMWPVLDELPHPELVRAAMQATVVIAGVLLLCNRAVRTCALLVGLTYFFATIASRGFYSNGRMFSSTMLVLIGLYAPPFGHRLLRAQMVILYFGTGLNKILQSDWRSGRYFEHWMIGILDNPLYTALASALPEMWLSLLVCWTTIALELTIALCLAVPAWNRFGIGLAVLFHLMSVALTGMSFGIFVIAATASLLVFVDWPLAGEIQVLRSGGTLGRWVARLRRVDFDGSISVVGRRAVRASELAVCWRGRTYEGIGALATLLLSLPVFYLLALVAFIVPSLVLRAMSR